MNNTHNQLPEWAIEAAYEKYPEKYEVIRWIGVSMFDKNKRSREIYLEGISLALDRVRETEKGDQGHCPRGCDCFFQQGRESVRKEVLEEE